MKGVIIVLLATGVILMVPLGAMQFSNEVKWDAHDFAVAAVLLIGTGLMYLVAARQTDKTAYRIAIGAALAAVLLLVWAHLAVGVF